MRTTIFRDYASEVHTMLGFNPVYVLDNFMVVVMNLEIALCAC